MIPQSTIFSFLILLVFASAGFSQGFANGVQLTTVKAPWVMRILGQDLDITGVQAKPDQESAYFMMASDTAKVNVSVFIEPAQKCKTAVECRDLVLNAGNPKWGKFEQLKKGTIGDASYFQFYRPEVDGLPVRMLDMYAQFVTNGYWVDMHISKAMYEKKDDALFENIVKTTSFAAKTEKGTSPFDAEAAKGQSAAVNWLSVWDASKCSESFRTMAAVTRAENKEASWADYCKKINGFVGAVNTRTPIAVALTSSLPPKTDRPLAIFAYHTDFANRPSVVEIVGLLLEKDGRWAVTNYTPQ